MLVAALCQGRDANVKMNTKQWRTTSIWWGGFITITWEWLRAVSALVLAQPVLASQQVQRGVQVRVDLVHAVPDGLQGGPPVGGLGLLLGGHGGQQEEQERGRGHPHGAASPASHGPPEPRRRARPHGGPGRPRQRLQPRAPPPPPPCPRLLPGWLTRPHRLCAAAASRRRRRLPRSPRRASGPARLRQIGRAHV